MKRKFEQISNRKAFKDIYVRGEYERMDRSLLFLSQARICDYLHAFL